MRKHTFLSFVFFLFLSLLLLLFSRTAPGRFLTAAVEVPIAFVGKSFVSIPQFFSSTMDQDVREIREENLRLQKKMLDLQLLERENKALRDQFISEKPLSTMLLPARIVAAPRFVPGVTPPETLIIDKGERDGVVVGQGVVFGGYLVGKVYKTSQHLSEVMLITNKNFSTVARVVESQALGVVKGEGGGEMVFGNVTLSETMRVGDSVVPFGEARLPAPTRGEPDGQGDSSQLFVPSDVVIGSITAVEKHASDVFQSARLRSALDVSKRSTVFVFIGVEE